jgi:hypothetical protein
MVAPCPDESFWDGLKAVALATHACELTEWKTPFWTLSPLPMPKWARDNADVRR